MALTVFYTPRARLVNTTGQPMNGCKFRFYEAGTSTPLDVFSDVDGQNSLGPVVTADSAGLFVEIFMLPQAYKVEFYTAADVLVWTADDFFPPAAAEAANNDFTAIAGVAFSAGELAYISDGSGALNAGQAYKADADLEYASATPEMGFVVSAVSIGETVTLRAAGVLSGLTGLTPGALYFVSASAGAINTTPGLFRRMVAQAKSTTELIVATNPPVLGEVTSVIDARIKGTVDGRLTLTTGVPVTTGDVSAAGTLFFTPYKGNEIAAYTGTRWTVLVFAEMSVAAPAVGNQMYDVFFDYNDGTPQLVLLAWTNDTTRATALATQDGVLVKTGDTQQRYLGSVRTVTASQFNDTYARRHVWNYYNRVQTPMRVLEATDSWQYTTATIRQANAAVANQLDIVCGVAEDPMDARLHARAFNTNAGTTMAVGIGEDSTTAFATGSLMSNLDPSSAADVIEFEARYVTYPAVGRHFYTWLEYSEAVGTTQWYGDGGTPTLIQTGIFGMWWK